MDLGIDVFLSMFCADGLRKIFDTAQKKLDDASPNSHRIFDLRQQYLRTIDPVVAFLQGSRPDMARKIATEQYLPMAGRFANLDYVEWAFGSMGIADKAKHLATLYLEDLSDFIVDCVDPDFGVSRYAEQIGQSAASFDALDKRLSGPASYVEELMMEMLRETIQRHQPSLVCITVPFPGNLLGAFRCAKWIKANFPAIPTALGGGFVNTELRKLSDPRIFEYFDFVSLDDGELPVQLIFEHVSSGLEVEQAILRRTFICVEGSVFYNNLSLIKDPPQHELGTPDYSDLRLEHYVSTIEIANPMHSLWNDGKWLKLTMAHGCYWGKCTFCDISLDYIKNYEPLTAKLLVNRMEAMMQQTGLNGFHFVDEAAPPVLMRDLAIEIIRRDLNVSWWANIRFEKSFSRDLCRLLSASGCIAVSGGLEVASNRLLKLIDKGVTVEQVARVADHFTQAGILVHAYLMYGYPSQTEQETIDSLEMVRQIFELGVVQSGFWHQFSLTAHSPIGLQPKKFGIEAFFPESTFALNDLDFEDKTGVDHDKFSEGLRKSLYNYMHGIGFEIPLQDWFDFPVPESSISHDYILQSIENGEDSELNASTKLVWQGAIPIIQGRRPNGLVGLVLQGQLETETIWLEVSMAKWWYAFAIRSHVNNASHVSAADFRKDFETQGVNFNEFMGSDAWPILREHGLLLI